MGSPFGIRKKLKALLRSEPEESPEPPPRFTLIITNGEGREESYNGEVDQTILMASGNVATPIASGCSDSTCATCRIEVIEGEDLLSPPQPIEARTLEANDKDSSLRLACQTTVVHEGTVKVRGFEFLE